jgi:hypothetical protein
MWELTQIELALRLTAKELRGKPNGIADLGTIAQAFITLARQLRLVSVMSRTDVASAARAQRKADGDEETFKP